MSYTGSDDDPLCDVCTAMYPDGWPDGFIAPWPVTGPLWDADGRMTRDRCYSFHLCLSCLQALVLKARLSRDARALAIGSRDRWEASQALLASCRAIGKARSEAA